MSFYKEYVNKNWYNFGFGLTNFFTMYNYKTDGGKTLEQPILFKKLESISNFL